MNDSAVLTLILKAKDLASKEVSGVGKSIGGMGETAKLAALGGVALLVAGLGSAVGAAIEEQKGIARLDSALKASIPNWNGNRDAIEGVISQREDLAFSDDSLRDSFAVLVTSTKDVTEATNLQAIAMDLARFKGVDLATASEAVAKASQGSTKEIKALGLEVDDTASAQQNLATIQAATSGQAAAFAKTMSGRWETFNNKMGDVVETIGGAFLPIIEGAMDFLLTTAIPAIQGVVDWLSPLFRLVGDIAGALSSVLGPALHTIIGVLGTFIGWVRDAIDALRTFLGLNSKASDPHFSPQQEGHQGPAPRMATGGIVLHSPGGTQVTLGEGEFDEAVIPLRRGRSRSSSVSGQPAVIVLNIDGREVAKVVDERLYYALRRAAPSSGPA